MLLTVHDGWTFAKMFFSLLPVGIPSFVLCKGDEELNARQCNFFQVFIRTCMYDFYQSALVISLLKLLRYGQ